MAVNEGLHELPPLCYPPSDSDDESFVVLGRSLGPDSPREIDEPVGEVFTSNVIEESLDIAADALSQMNNSDLASAPEMPMFKSQLSFKSCEMTDNEIQEKVDMLIDENNKLKETLFQNNIVMKTQFQTLKKWQEDVERVHESHKEKFGQTKIYIENLLKENKRLTEIVNSKDPGVELKLETSKKVEKEIIKNLKLEEDIQKLKQENEEMTKENKKLKQENENMKLDNEKVKQEVNALEQSNANTFEEFAIKQHKYLEQITNLKFLNEKLKAYENCGEEINNLRRQLMEAQMSLTQLKSSFDGKEQKYLDEIQNLKALNEKSLAEIQNLKALNEKSLDEIQNLKVLNEKSSSDCSIEEANQLRKHLLDTMSQLKKVEKMKHDAQTESQMYLQKITELEKRLNLEKQSVEYKNLEQKFNICKIDLENALSAKNILLFEKNELADNAALLSSKYYDLVDQMNRGADGRGQTVLKEGSNALYVEEINNLKEKLKVSLQDKEEVSKLRKQLMDAQISLTQERESKKATETEARANRNKINELEAKIKEFNKNNDRNVALENQLELYRSDFEAERKSKENLLREKNEVVEDLRILQNRNEQLISEVDSLRSKCTFVEVTSAAAAASAVAQPSAPPSPPPTTYSCPLCSQRFRSYKMIEDHVQLCINTLI